MQRRDFLRRALSLGAVGILPGAGLIASDCIGEAAPLPEAATMTQDEVEALLTNMSNSIRPVCNTIRKFSYFDEAASKADDMIRSWPANSVLTERIQAIKWCFSWTESNTPSEGEPLIWVAAVRGDWESLKQCLDQDPSLITSTGNVLIGLNRIGLGEIGEFHRLQDLPLIHIVATWPDHGKALRHLVSLGADVNSYHESALTPLYCAVRWSPHMKTLKYLVSEGADIGVKNHYNETLLHRAVELNDLEVVKYLVSQGADIHAQADKISGLGTPLHCAAGEAGMEMVRCLHSLGADVHAKSLSGASVLRAAVTNRTEFGLEIVKFLVAQGNDVNAKDDRGNTPLHVADLSNVEILQYLVSKGADIHARNDKGETPLYQAVYSAGCLDIVEYLVSQDADVNARTNDGMTPLHNASRESWRTDVLQCLISHGADVHARDNEGKTPLDHANEEKVRHFLQEAAKK